MPKPILVGYDPERGDRAPVLFGAAAARFTGAPLIVASVFSDAADHGRPGHGGRHEDLGPDTSEAVEGIRTELARDGIHTECMAVPGTSAPSALHRTAESVGAGLLVVGSTHRGATGRVLLGSTAERLIHGAPCALAVVPAGWTPGGGLTTVGAAYTDTPEGRAALHGAIALARRAGAKVRVLTAVHPHEIGKDAGDGPAKESTGYDVTGMEMLSATARLLAEAGVDADGVDVEADVSVQDAADFLIAASQNVDLLVCGSRGYGPHRAVLLGGVSRRVVAEARCPAIVLARGVEHGLEGLVGEQAGAAV